MEILCQPLFKVAKWDKEILSLKITVSIKMAELAFGDNLKNRILTDRTIIFTIIAGWISAAPDAGFCGPVKIPFWSVYRKESTGFVPVQLFDYRLSD